MNFIKKLSANILILLVFTIISLSLAEGIMRVFDLSCISFKNPFTKNLGIWRADEESGHDFIENYPQINFSFKDSEYPIWTNEFGCFDRPYEEEEDYVLVVGDSITWGYVPFENVWGYSLEKLTGKRVLKCGMPGYGTKEEFFKIRKVVNKTGNMPELIVIGYFMNDIDSDYVFPGITVIDGYRVDKVNIADHETGEKNVRSDEELRKRLNNMLKYGSSVVPETIRDRVQIWLINNSVLYNFLRTNNVVREIAGRIGLQEKSIEQRYHYIASSLFMKDSDEVNWIKKAWDDHLNNIMEIKHLSDGMGSKLLVVNIPTKEMTYKFLNPAFDREAYTRGVERLAEFHKTEGIAFLDLTDDFNKYSDQEPRSELNSDKDLFWRCDPHMNRNGNRLTGLLAAKYVLENQMVETEGVAEKLARVEERLNSF